MLTQNRYLDKLSSQFHRLAIIKQAQYKKIEKKESKGSIELSTRKKFEQQFAEVCRSVMHEKVTIPEINTLFYVSESEYQAHKISFDQTSSDQYLVQAPIANVFTTVFLVGEIFSKFEIVEAYLIHNQNDSAGEIESLDVLRDFIFDGVALENNIYQAELAGMLYLTPREFIGKLSSVVIEFRVLAFTPSIIQT